VNCSAEIATVTANFSILARVESLLTCLILKWLQDGYKNRSQMKLDWFNSVESDRAV
jgi:hypothetical protein